MLLGLKVLKQRITRNIVKYVLIVVKLFLSKAPYQNLLKERLIAFVRSVLFEKKQKTNCAMNR